MSDRPKVSGWCSPPHCGPRGHGICQGRLDKGQLDRCGCTDHGGHTTKDEDAA